MIRQYIVMSIIVFSAMTAGVNDTTAGDLGFFRTIPVETPERGIIRMSNTSYFSNFNTNPVLSRNYGIKDPRIFGSVTEFELGITNYMNFNGSLPYYADMFKQGSKSGKKTGAGDVVLGFRLAKKIDDPKFKGFSFGGRVRIPEQLGYGPEPLGFRTFSYGKLAYSVEASTGFKIKFADCNFSVSMIQFPNAAKRDSAFTTDSFYNTGFGYMGIGSPNTSGLAEGLFQNQVHLSLGTSVTISPRIAGILEFNSTMFIEKSKREDIMTLAPGFRIGSADGFNLSAGMDYALSGAIPDKTFMFRLRVPTLSARGIKQLLARKSTGPMIRSQNSLVALNDFTRSDMTFMYADELKQSLHKDMTGTGLLSVVSDEKIKNAFRQESLATIPDKPQQLGVRLGANYLINAEITDYNVKRSSSFKIPLIVSFPETSFSLSVNASVTDLVTGESHSLGIISSRITKSRGVLFFPVSASSDIEFISALERRDCENQLLSRWVEEFNSVLMDKIEIFGWEPKKTELNETGEISG
ncbi:hypothetical protein ACFL6K_04960 [Candidatus Latescibacterota bacterium]